jgi:hypothetical protein
MKFRHLEFFVAAADAPGTTKVESHLTINP